MALAELSCLLLERDSIRKLTIDLLAEIREAAANCPLNGIWSAEDAQLWGEFSMALNFKEQELIGYDKLIDPFIADADIAAEMNEIDVHVRNIALGRSRLKYIVPSHVVLQDSRITCEARAAPPKKLMLPQLEHMTASVQLIVTHEIALADVSRRVSCVQEEHAAVEEVSIDRTLEVNSETFNFRVLHVRGVRRPTDIVRLGCPPQVSKTAQGRMKQMPQFQWPLAEIVLLEKGWDKVFRSVTRRLENRRVVGRPTDEVRLGHSKCLPKLRLTPWNPILLRYWPVAKIVLLDRGREGFLRSAAGKLRNESGAGLPHWPEGGVLDFYCEKSKGHVALRGNPKSHMEIMEKARWRRQQEVGWQRHLLDIKMD